MPTPSQPDATNWITVAGQDNIARVQAAIMADPAFQAEALIDLNGSVKRRMGIDFPLPLTLKVIDEVGFVWPKTEEFASFTPTPAFEATGELSDADLDLVSGGCSSKQCTIIPTDNSQICQTPGT